MIRFFCLIDHHLKIYHLTDKSLIFYAVRSVLNLPYEQCLLLMPNGRL